MTTPANAKRIASLKTLSRAFTAIVIVIGGLVLLGWFLDIPTLKSVLPGLVTMKANTALAFISAGLSLRLLRDEAAGPRSRRITHLLAGIVALIGLLTLTEYVFGWNMGIDQLLFRESREAVGTSSPGRMAPNTALNFLLVGIALLILDVETRRNHRPAQFLILTATLISLLALIGYLYGVTALYGITSYTKMALHTAVAFTLLCLGILFARPGRGLMQVLIGDTAGGALLRRLLPVVIGVPIAIGWVRLLGQRAGLYDTEFGVSLSMLSSVVLLGALIWMNTRVLDRKEIEREQAEEERDRYYNLSPDMLCIAGFDGYFKELNPAWETTLGWTRAELRSKPYLEFVHPEDRTPTTTEAQNLSGGRATLTFENRYQCKDGSYKWLQWNAIPLEEQQLIYATARDITERKQAENAIKQLNENLRLTAARLEAANKELEAFSYSVSHDLRAPLRSIDGFSKAVLEDYGDKLDAQGKDHLQRVRTATQRMAQLIDDMLNLSRVTRAEMRHEQVDMTALAHAVADELMKAQPERTVDFVIAEGIVAQGDARLLRAVLENLLGNAWKFTGKHPRARIEFGIAEKEGRRVYFVRDDGAGFEMAYADKLFGAFQRLHAVTEFPGTGIGLATVQRIVHRHGGRVWTEGAVGQGATFYFTL